jgi:hypothetical protein
VKFLRRENNHLLFSLRGTEREVLTWALKLYPVVPAGQAKVTRTGLPDPNADHQQLLDEALAAQRKENEQRLQEFLADRGRFEKAEGFLLFRLTDSEADWLLEVLNDIRVGSWVRLGRPTKDAETNLPLDPQTMRHLWAMESAGRFETLLLEGLATAV